jgi:hypothetical protein
MIVYPLDRLYEEMAYIAHQFHWPHAELMSLDHVERQRWVAEIARIPARAQHAAEAGAG